MLKRSFRTLPAVLAIAALASPAFAGEVEERNKAIARTVLEEILGQGRFEKYESLHSPDLVVHGSTRDVGRAEDRESTQGWRQAFPDLRITIDKIIAEGDLVAVRFIGEGTNTGASDRLPATGKRVRIPGMSIFRIVDGKIVEEWTSFDQLDFMRQLGLDANQLELRPIAGNAWRVTGEAWPVTRKALRATGKAWRVTRKALRVTGKAWRVTGKRCA
jgi:steroid delta-isomerase-like uncharacterized protein